MIYTVLCLDICIYNFPTTAQRIRTQAQLSGPTELRRKRSKCRAPEAPGSVAQNSREEEATEYHR